MAKRTSTKLKLPNDFLGVVQALLNTPPDAQKEGEAEGQASARRQTKGDEMTPRITALSALIFVLLLRLSSNAQSPPLPPPLPPIGHWSSVLTLAVPPIVFDQVQRVTNGNLSGPSFGNVSVSCRSTDPIVTGLISFEPHPITLMDVLGPDVRALSVRQYHTWRFKTDDEVRDFVRATLTASPQEGIRPRPPSMGTMTNVVIVTEWEGGRLGRIDLGGLPEGGRYAHLEDSRGCQWWAQIWPKL